MEWVHIILIIILFTCELIYFRIANQFNIIDKPNLRSSHTRVTLRGGGIIFLVGAWIWALGGWIGNESLRNSDTYWWFLIGLTMIAIISFVDDLHSLPDSVRLVVQFVAMLLMFYELGLLQWSLWWAVLIGLIVCVGVVNAYNFMDGINGITGGYSLAVLIPLMVVNGGVDGGFIDMSFLIVVGLSVLVFCFFNFRKRARCFAGDVGSVSIAFILVFTIGRLMIKTLDFSYIIFLAVYGVDSVLTIIHRIMLHENLGEAHRKHAYQLMANELKMPHVVVSLIYMGLQLLVSLGLLFLPVNHYVYSGVVLAVLCLAYVVFIRKYYWLHEEYLRGVEPMLKQRE